MNSVLYSSNSDNWRTPRNMYNYFVEYLGCFDPCPFNDQPSFDGLSIEWRQNNFVNPPYSKLKAWVEKSIIESKKGKHVYMLVPARTDTQAFKLLFEFGCKFDFIIGRLHFNNSSSGAPFPSVLVELLGGGKNFIYYMDRNQFE